MTSYLETCQSAFWKDVFEQECLYIVKALEGCTKVLSVGCGPAIIEKGLLEHGFKVTGLDVSEEAIEGVPDTMRTVIGTAENMEFEDASFDAAIFVASLQFIEDYRSAIAEAARVLRPSGKIVVMLLNPESAYFKENTKAPDSYMSKIKHRDLAQLKKVMKEYYSVQTEYYLGIKGKEIFPSSDPAVASLYIINGIKG